MRGDNDFGPTAKERPYCGRHPSRYLSREDGSCVDCTGETEEERAEDVADIATLEATVYSRDARIADLECQVRDVLRTLASTDTERMHAQTSVAALVERGHDLIVVLCMDREWNKQVDDAVLALQAVINDARKSLASVSPSPPVTDTKQEKT